MKILEEILREREIEKFWCKDKEDGTRSGAIRNNIRTSYMGPQITGLINGIDIVQTPN
jgi:hypothetical protein